MFKNHGVILSAFLPTLIILGLSDEGDYVNQFVVRVNGGNSEAEEVIGHLTKRHAIVQSQLYTEQGGYTIHFVQGDASSRSKRSVGSDEFLTELTAHPLVISIDQQQQLIRTKRDYNSKEEIKLAQRTLYDKQLELAEPIFYEDKSVFRRVNMDRSNPLLPGYRDTKDYIPGEDRADLELNDPYWHDQWYLNNVGQAGGEKGLDINVVPAWQDGFTGKGVYVCILDDGLEHTHDDLKLNYAPEISADFNDPNDKQHDPTPNPANLEENSHGTRCAGEVAAYANNSVCGVGVAFHSKIGGVRILDGPVTDSLEAQALLFQNQLVDIYSASWGPRDDGKTMEGPNEHCRAALEEGVKTGRGGKGSIYVWATGNGGYNGDDCGADGYVSSPYTLSIGSINNYAQSTYFMEWCPSTMAVIYTGGYHNRNDAFTNDERTHPLLKIVTVDTNNRCTLNFQGTSSAAPLAAGVFALVLQANGNLTWRDVQHLVVRTSKIPNEQELGWTINGARWHINDKFGFGALDAGRLVAAAQDWENVGPQHTCEIFSEKGLNLRFSPLNPLMVSLDSDGCQRNNADRIDKLEHVQMHIKLSHPRRGNVNLTLISPAGTRSEMLSPRPNDDKTEGIDFTFMTVRCWDENPRGTWKLLITDAGNDNSLAPGVLESWSLRLLGTAHAEDKRKAGEATDRKAFDPDVDALQKIMSAEATAAENVNIQRGGEEDVIQRFSFDKKSKAHSSAIASAENDELLKKTVQTFLQGKSNNEVQALIAALERSLEVYQEAKRENQKRELYDKLTAILLEGGF